jgi:hypothetical protein
MLALLINSVCDHDIYVLIHNLIKTNEQRLNQFYTLNLHYYGRIPVHVHTCIGARAKTIYGFSSFCMCNYVTAGFIGLSTVEMAPASAHKTRQFIIRPLTSLIHSCFEGGFLETIFHFSRTLPFAHFIHFASWVLIPWFVLETSDPQLYSPHDIDQFLENVGSSSIIISCDRGVAYSECVVGHWDVYSTQTSARHEEEEHHWSC